jgi:hypothetical protein
VRFSGKMDDGIGPRFERREHGLLICDITVNEGVAFRIHSHEIIGISGIG